jgi:hypothetical protein
MALGTERKERVRGQRKKEKHTSLNSHLSVRMMSPIDLGVISSDHCFRWAGSAWTAKLVIQLTRADSA